MQPTGNPKHLQKTTVLSAAPAAAKHHGERFTLVTRTSTYLHKDARPLGGGEGNFVHKMRDVPGKKKKKMKNWGDVRPKITAVGGRIIRQCTPLRWVRVMSSSKK